MPLCLFNFFLVFHLGFDSFISSFHFSSASVLSFHAPIDLESWIVTAWQPPPCPSLTPIAARCPQRSTPSPLSGSPWLWEAGAPPPLPRLPFRHCPQFPTAVANTCLRPFPPVLSHQSQAALTASPPWPPRPPPLFPHLTHPGQTPPRPSSPSHRLKWRTSCSPLHPHICHVVWVPAVDQFWRDGWGGRKT